MHLLAFLHIDDVENLTEVARNVLAGAAIVVGGIWGYRRFIRERTRWPRAALRLEFTDLLLGGDSRLLSVKLHVANDGRGLMRLENVRFDLARVLPLGEQIRARITAGCAYPDESLEADWPSISSRERSWTGDKRPELEPGECDQYSCDFFLERSEQLLFLYAYVDNVQKGRFRKKNLGWTCTAFHELAPASKGGVSTLARLIGRSKS